MGSKLSEAETSRLHDQLIKLGDMMGDGLHYESDGKWIAKEYNKVFNALYPEHKKEIRKNKAQRTDESIRKLIQEHKSKCCNVDLRQSRSGSLIVYCTNTECNKRYKAVTKKK